MIVEQPHMLQRPRFPPLFKGSEAATVIQAQKQWIAGAPRTGFCPICRSRGCAHLEKLQLQIQLKQKKKLTRDVFGASPPNAFIGTHGYPFVNIGPLVGIDDSVDSKTFDHPADWYGKTVNEIVEFRSMLARGKKMHSVKQESRTLSELQDVVLSSQTIDLEVRFRKELSFSVALSPVTQPMGPSAEMERMRLAGNPTIPRKVDSLLEENLKTRDAVDELMKRNYDVYYLQKLLSIGVFGQRQRKRLVPTRWSITATDKMTADHYIDEIKTLPWLPEIRVYSNEYLFNRFDILLIPGPWEFEQFEAWQKGSAWSAGGKEEWGFVSEYEPYKGRSDYAEKEAGGYYAGRFGAAEALAKQLRKQAKVVVFREIGKEYNMPVGVWAVRQTVREAFKKPPYKFATRNEAEEFLKNRLKVSMRDYAKGSRVLPQRKLTEY
ncbi:hypothetical protein KJ765_06530 [Candidatus Micrarchaeota archaeon]|nr:hypothetical protein [Candidatus Micrarchaeota archaeon]